VLPSIFQVPIDGPVEEYDTSVHVWESLRPSSARLFLATVSVKREICGGTPPPLLQAAQMICEPNRRQSDEYTRPSCDKGVLPP
jgi:hypothetical protein